eukprot:TRINITY_DN1448_c0_g1_i1.p1 TRINITY_DN1448_c0_g1~~TRINITY_DN1448_c0_g1_i1.p1  ORF type:complete len:609 (+),score=144.33 TRINITY_DN1448_c0_g1_i1:156-1982(+)
MVADIKPMDMPGDGLSAAKGTPQPIVNDVDQVAICFDSEDGSKRGSKTDTDNEGSSLPLPDDDEVIRVDSGEILRQESVEALEARIGKLGLSTRYHRPPASIDDDYTVTSKELGTGNNGVVRLAYRKKTSKQHKFAVKAFHYHMLDKEQREHLESEVNVFLSVDHPHIARLFDVYDSETHLHMVMECLEGGELFDRVAERKAFSECDAADTLRQMLLALNYIHIAGIVHRDIKLENWMYDTKVGNHLKLIDFGFSKVFDPAGKMNASCGTLAYAAPEVLKRSYTKQCDVWGVGVITFILLSGYMPFSGSDEEQVRNITIGNYKMRKDRWQNISPQAKECVFSMLQVNPEQRLTVMGALKHPWVVERHKLVTKQIDRQVVEALRQYGNASKFKRCALNLMAWSLSNEERAKVRGCFLAMDKNHEGTITLAELKQVMETFSMPENETLEVFKALDSNGDCTIHYSDFLAAMLTHRIALHTDLLLSAFKRFDRDNTGFITADNLRDLLGDSYKGEQVEEIIKDADILQDGKISYAEFVSHLSGKPLDEVQALSEQIIDRELAKTTSSQRRWSGGGWSAPWKRQRSPELSEPSDSLKPAPKAGNSPPCCSVM